MDYTALESSIILRLSTLTSVGVDAIAMPDTDSDMVQPFDRGKITVAYLSSDFDLSESNDCVSQPEKITFQLVVQSRWLRGTLGIYPLLKAIKSLLLGWQTPTTGKIHFSKATYVAHENSVWTYSLNLTTENLANEEPDDVDLVISRMLTAVNESNETIVVESTVPIPDENVEV